MNKDKNEFNKRLIHIYEDNDRRWDNKSVSKLLGYISSKISFIKRSSHSKEFIDDLCSDMIIELRELTNEFRLEELEKTIKELKL